MILILLNLVVNTCPPSPEYLVMFRIFCLSTPSKFRTLLFSDHYSRALNTNSHPREISHRLFPFSPPKQILPSHENHYFLGPIGNLDPTDFIIGETNRIPFLGHWKNIFKSWPSLEKTTPEKSWTTWYKRVSASKKVHWDEIGIGQALALTIANSAKDEPLMAAATYFWSNTINAFLFNQGR